MAAPEGRPTPDDTYTHGHHASVLRSHEWRTAANSAPHLLPHLRPGMRLLDVGCGPGTITIDLARRVAPGEVLGIDRAAEVVDRAAATAASVRSSAAAGGGAATFDGAVRFAVDDVYALDQPDGSWDVVHAHQVLQHLTDPVAALRELRRVLVPGGLLAVRDGDYAGFFWTPADPRLDRWLELYHQVTAANRAEADAGRHLPAWVRAAGFTDLEVTATSWTYADPASRTWWGDLWAERASAPDSPFARQAIEYGLADEAELAAVADGFRSWAAEPDGVFVVPSVEVLARA